jgi:hypothetical protein
LPTTIQGFEVITRPKDTQIESFPIFIQVPAGVTRTVTFPTEFLAIAISLMIDNLDGAAACSFRINNSTDPMIPLTASSFRSFSDMNIVSVTVTTAAVTGSVVISGQMAALPKPLSLGFL